MTDQDSNTSSTDQPVAFSAYNSAGGWVRYYADERIPFTGLEYNSGSYRARTSTFVCLAPGVYYFSVNVYFRLDADNAAGMSFKD